MPAILPAAGRRAPTENRGIGHLRPMVGDTVGINTPFSSRYPVKLILTSVTLEGAGGAAVQVPLQRSRRCGPQRRAPRPASLSLSLSLSLARSLSHSLSLSSISLPLSLSHPLSFSRSHPLYFSLSLAFSLSLSLPLSLSLFSLFHPLSHTLTPLAVRG